MLFVFYLSALTTSGRDSSGDCHCYINDTVSPIQIVYIQCSFNGFLYVSC